MFRIDSDLPIVNQIQERTMKSFRPSRIALLLALLAGMAATSSSFAQPSGQGGQGGGDRPHGPPPEAIAACKGKSADAACSFTNREGDKRTGTCFAPPAREGDSAGKSGGERPLACRPEKAGDQGPGKGSGKG